MCLETKNNGYILKRIRLTGRIHELCLLVCLSAHKIPLKVLTNFDVILGKGVLCAKEQLVTF